MKKSRLIYALMLSTTIISFEANATYSACPSECEFCYCENYGNNQMAVYEYWDADGIMVLSENRKYDDDGKLIEAFIQTQFGGPSKIEQYIYNDQGQLIYKNTKSQTSDDDSVYYYKSYNDTTGTAIVTPLYENFNATEHQSQYSYNNDGKLTEVYTDGNLSEKYTYNYDGNGNLTEQHYYDLNNGNNNSSEKYLYNSKGDLLETEKYWWDGRLREASFYENGHLVKKVLQEGEEETGTFSVTTYDSSGNKISENYFYEMGGGCDYNDETFEWSCREDIGNGRTIICIGEVSCEQYYLEDENGNLSECSTFATAIFGITIEDEQRANAPQSQRFELSDGSTKIIDADGKVHYEGKRIYTVDEANQVAGKVNRVSIRYR